MIFTTENADQTEEVGRRIGKALGPGAIVALHGALGAGKTVLTKGIAHGLGITTTITSPSFTIVDEHTGPVMLRHIDLYRTDSDEELELLGFSELVSGDGIAVVEWAEKAAHFLDEDCVDISIKILDDGTREIRVKDSDITFSNEL